MTENAMRGVVHAFRDALSARAPELFSNVLADDLRASGGQLHLHLLDRGGPAHGRRGRERAGIDEQEPRPLRAAST